MDILYSITKFVAQLISACSFLGGIFFLWSAISTPMRNFGTSASEYLYTQGTYYAVVALALFVLGVVCQLAVYSSVQRLQRSLDAIKANTAKTNENVLQLSKALVRRQPMDGIR